MKNPVLPLLGALVITLGIPASAVSLDPDGKGQALIFPYYTAQSSAGNPFNTLVSIVNHASDSKVIRVRFREGRNAKEVASFNLYLSPNDTWTGAVVPTVSGGTSLFSSDRSCTNPALAGVGGTTRSMAFLPGAAIRDSLGSEPERTREGWIEAIEMATIVGESAAAVAHQANGEAVNCPAVQGAPSLQIGAPTGGISGTLTLINVSSGEDFTVNAEALAGLSRTAFYRHPDDSYPDFSAREIEPVSVVVANGAIFRSLWARPVDAVSALLMRSSWQGEVVVDAGTKSKTDFVVTFPTRHHYVTQAPPPPGFTVPPPAFLGTPPFSENGAGQQVRCEVYTREAGDAAPLPPILVLGFPFTERATFPGSSSVWDGLSSLLLFVTTPSNVLGSLNRAYWEGPGVQSSGWLALTTTNARPIESLPASTRTDMATGVVTTGSHRYSGLPVVGISVRTFDNGTLSCGGGNCQGKYGGAFPLKFTRTIE